MATVQEHYDKHLGRIYSWMLGEKAAAIEGARNDLSNSGVGAQANGLALDLGAGTGIYAIALADLGYRVQAIDSCQGLLDELKADIGPRPIKLIHGNLLSFRTHLESQVDLILCMGDTLTHLDSEEAIKRMFEDAKAALKPGGTFIATFRDYVLTPLQGTTRFFLVRSDNRRILTCFLEYGEKKVTVHDMLYELEDTGCKLTISAYPKLRLDPKHAASMLAKTGMNVRLEQGMRGMVRLVGEMPDSASYRKHQ
jgi:2-polyprenyl-3-methyl-5-hydroxy-6-metoxy-1,4-benzoquinol methylase